MREKEIRKLIQLVEQSNITELEVSRWWKSVRIRKHGQPVSQEELPSNEPVVQLQETEPQTELKAEPPPPENGSIHIVSPMVGTFYRAPAPNTDPFVNVNDVVQPGQTVCIVEAMKLMNEIESEVSGRIVKILVENGQPVEYNQQLFLLEPT